MLWLPSPSGNAEERNSNPLIVPVTATRPRAGNCALAGLGMVTNDQPLPSMGAQSLARNVIAIACLLTTNFEPDYFKLTACFKGKFCDDPPTMKLYSPGSSCQPFCSTLKIERYFGLTSTVSSLLSPALSQTLLKPTNRFGGSAAD